MTPFTRTLFSDKGCYFSQSERALYGNFIIINEHFSESLLALPSKTDSETNNVQIQSESVTVEECIQDSINREKNEDPLLDHCYQNTNELGTAGCARSTPNPYYVYSHCGKLRYHITKLQQDVEQLKCQVVNLEEVKKEFKVKGLPLRILNTQIA